MTSAASAPAMRRRIVRDRDDWLVLGLIGAVVAEFVSSTKGLGYLISAAAVNLETNTMFAALISLAVLGVAGSLSIRFLHSRIVFWDKGSASQTAATE